MNVSAPVPIAAFANMPVGTPVRHIAGQIAHVFPKANCRAPMQNIFVKDPKSGAEVKVLLQGLPCLFLDERRYRGGFIEIVAPNDSCMVYAEQEAYRNRAQPPKLEVKSPAEVVRLLTAEEFAQGSLFAGTSSAPPQPSTPPPAAAEPVAAPALPTAQKKSLGTVESEMSVLGAFLLLAMHQADLRVKQATEAGIPHCETADFFKHAVTTLFVQATRDGLHRRNDVNEFLARFDPDSVPPAPPSKVDELLAAIGSANLDRAEELLQSLGKLPAGGIRTLTESEATALLKSRFPQLLGAGAPTSAAA